MDAAQPQSHDDVRKHMGQYYVVFVALICLTAVTVGVSYLHLARPLAIAVALVIASIKAGLVAAVFMHLISEKKVIYAVLILTALFFALLLALPNLTVFEHHSGMPGT
jgi:cytochrome c oxidase subunit IV